jgi:hypothetical protein
MLTVGWFSGWSTFWAGFWAVLTVGEYNDDSAADEEFAMAFAASLAIAIGMRVWASSLAIRRRVGGWWPAGGWAVGFVGAGIFLAAYVVWAGGSQVEG